MKTLVTGAAGFVGFHLSLKLLKKGVKVVGIDNVNKYYSQKLKISRINELKKFKNFIFIRADICKNKTYKLLKKYKSEIDYIYHFAGQAGVRYSIQKPEVYIKNNVLAFVKFLEFFKQEKKLKLIFFASSSSVYGDKSKSSSLQSVDKPLSVYSASKISMELIANVYAVLYKKRIIGLRFFTVYGPWGRPDMSYYKFCDLAAKNKHIKVLNYGNHFRSFTFIDDLINNVILIKKYYSKNKNFFSKVYNIGNPKTLKLEKFISILEFVMNYKFIKIKVSKQMGDVFKTQANLTKEKKFSFKFRTKAEEGLKKFYNWYKIYNNNY